MHIIPIINYFSIKPAYFSKNENHVLFHLNIHFDVHLPSSIILLLAKT